MPREFSRHQRLGHQIMRTLNELVRFESKDPRLDGVSLTSVDLSRDLGVANVYFSILDPNGDSQAVAEGLASASGFLRSRLAREVKMRHVPVLRFVHDDSAAESVRISELIDHSLQRD